ncbi:MAG: glycerol-3-phosphate 1-O-acyltransferase PlsY [Verrucomicrobiota bacterium]
MQDPNPYLNAVTAGDLLAPAIIGYLIGSLPFGYLVAKVKGVNIFEVGSKSPGATNVRRVLGSGPGNLVFFLDALKGVIAAGWLPLCLWLHLFYLNDTQSEWAQIRVNMVGGLPPIRESAFVIAINVTSLIAALLGHSYSCFTKFRGGKGVATTAGGFLVLLPWVLVIAVAVWWTTFKISRYVSLASIFAALALPLAAFFLGEPPLLLGLSLIIAGFVVLRHRANIGRLLNGTENRFVKKSAPPQPPPS